MCQFLKDIRIYLVFASIGVLLAIVVLSLGLDEPTVKKHVIVDPVYTIVFSEGLENYIYEGINERTFNYRSTVRCRYNSKCANISLEDIDHDWMEYTVEYIGCGEETTDSIILHKAIRKKK